MLKIKKYIVAIVFFSSSLPIYGQTQGDGRLLTYTESDKIKDYCNSHQDSQKAECLAIRKRQKETGEKPYTGDDVLKSLGLTRDEATKMLEIISKNKNK